VDGIGGLGDATEALGDATEALGDASDAPLDVSGATFDAEATPKLGVDALVDATPWVVGVSPGGGFRNA
jgi:hypothetical protein